MRILIATDLFPPVINGVSTFSKNLAEGLAKRGHEVVVIAPSQQGKKMVEKEHGYIVERTSSLKFPFYQNLRISTTPGREVRRIIKKYDPDVIHIQMVLGIGYAVLQAAQKMKIPLVSTNHAIPENVVENIRLLAPLSRPISTLLEHYAMRFHSNADFLTAPTQAAINMFGDKYASVKKPIQAVSNGIDLSIFSSKEPDESIYKKYSIPKNVPIILYVGRLDGEKHLHVLLRAVQEVMAYKKCHVVLVGGGVESDSLKVLSTKLGIAHHTTFTGKVSDADLVELYRTGTVFGMPSPAELQSIATLEAMASGLPIVAVNKGALHELCQDGKNGYLFKYDDSHMMAGAMLKILKNKSLRSQMSKVSVEIAQKHDLTHTLETFEKIYSHVIKRNRQ